MNDAHDPDLLSLVQPLLRDSRTLTLRCSTENAGLPEYTAVLRSKSGSSILYSRDISVSRCVHQLLQGENWKKQNIESERGEHE